MSSIFDILIPGKDEIGEGFNTGFGIFDDMPLDELIASFTGATAAEAARLAAEQQIAFSNEALDLLRGDLQPFRDLMREEDLQRASTLATDPQAQADFLRTSPLFANLSESAAQDIFKAQSAAGALGSSGTDEMLSNTILGIGNELVNQQVNRTFPLLKIAQASGAQQGAGGADLLTGIGNAMAGGRIGASNAMAQGSQNTMSALSAFASMFGNMSRSGSSGAVSSRPDSATISSGDYFAGYV